MHPKIPYRALEQLTDLGPTCTGLDEALENVSCVRQDIAVRLDHH